MLSLESTTTQQDGKGQDCLLLKMNVKTLVEKSQHSRLAKGRDCSLLNMNGKILVEKSDYEIWEYGIGRILYMKKFLK